jgi:3'-5' exoribonuclease
MLTTTGQQVANNDRVRSRECSRAERSSLIEEARRLKGIQFRVIRRTDKLDRAGRACLRLELGNLSGTATAFIRHDEFAAHQRNVHHGDIVLITGELQEMADRFLIRIDEICRAHYSCIRPTALLPKEWVLPNFTPQLRTVIRHWLGISSPALKRFMADVFLDASNALGFLNVPASKRCHHVYQGGLLDHTADMLLKLEETTWFQERVFQRDLATVLVVLHDIGKTVTFFGRNHSSRAEHQSVKWLHWKCWLRLLRR